MDSFYLGLSIGLSVAVCVVAAVLVRGPLLEYLAARRRRQELDALFAATTRQLRLDNWQRRRELYAAFRNAAAGLVEELADGRGRWASFYLARDLLRDVNERGAPDAALAARQMCFVCQKMLNSGFSDELSVKFDQSARRYDVACRDDLANMELTSSPGSGSPQPSFDPDSTDEVPDTLRRRYYNVLR